MRVKLYLEVKKHVSEFAMYPLCNGIIDKKVGEIHCFDTTSSVIVWVEGAKKDAHILTAVESNIEHSCYLPELKVINYITDTTNEEVKEKLLYKDKAMLIAVMIKYKIDQMLILYYKYLIIKGMELHVLCCVIDFYFVFSRLMK